jgi:threonine dehydrogenase-like Zn-dependent dehydrogenase
VELREFDITEPDLYEVQVEVKASGLCAWDLHLYEGHLPDGEEHPLLHGHEGAGIVRKVGARVKDLAPGDKVCAMGDYSKLLANRANVPQQYVSKLRQEVTQFEHWIAEPVACVLNGLEWSQIVPGDRIALIGSGFMGLLFIQALRYSLAREVIAIDIDEARLGLAEQFGADVCLNPDRASDARLIAALARDKVDLAIECAGVERTFQMAYEMVRKGGRVNIFSAQRGAPRRVDLAMWHGLGLQVYASSPSIAPDFTRIFARTVPLMERGIFDLKPLVTHVVPPEQAPDLYETALNKRDGYIKGVICW